MEALRDLGAARGAQIAQRNTMDQVEQILYGIVPDNVVEAADKAGAKAVAAAEKSAA